MEHIQQSEDAIAQCVHPLIGAHVGFMDRWTRLLWGAILAALSQMLRLFLIVGPDLLALGLLAFLVSLRPRYQTQLLIGLLVLLASWEILYRWKLPLMSWNRQCSRDSEGAWQIALATSSAADPLSLGQFRR